MGKAMGVTGTGEGIVFVPAAWKDTHVQRSRYFLKFKGDEHKVVNISKLKRFEKGPATDFKEKTRDFVEAVLTENRMQQGLDYLKEMQHPLEMSSVGVFLKWLTDDVVKEEGDLMQKFGLDSKLVKKAVSSKAQPWYKFKVN